MKIYKITSYFKLNKNPAWLDTFIQNYSANVNGYHSTFKFQSSINASEINTVANIVERTVSKYAPTEVIFDNYVFDITSSGNIIMIASKKNNPLYTFQQELITSLESYGIPLRDEYPRFEQNVLLHITIARRRSDSDFDIAKSLLREPVLCTAFLDTVTLTVVDNWVEEEFKDPSNLTVFRFKN